MASNQFSEKSPPPFNKATDNYEKWKKFQLMILRLDDDTQGAILDLMTENQRKAETGAATMLEHLDRMFPKDESVTAFEAYEEFESYERPAELSMNDYCTEFNRRLSKVKASGTQLSEHVLAYRMLRSANLSDAEIQLVKATITIMNYENMTKQLKRVFHSGASQMSALKIKEEPSETFYGYNRGGRNGRNDSYRNNDGYRNNDSYRNYSQS